MSSYKQKQQENSVNISVSEQDQSSFEDQDSKTYLIITKIYSIGYQHLNNHFLTLQQIIKQPSLQTLDNKQISTPIIYGQFSSETKGYPFRYSLTPNCNQSCIKIKLWSTVEQQLEKAAVYGTGQLKLPLPQVNATDEQQIQIEIYQMSNQKKIVAIVQCKIVNDMNISQNQQNYNLNEESMQQISQSLIIEQRPQLLKKNEANNIQAKNETSKIQVQQKKQHKTQQNKQPNDISLQTFSAKQSLDKNIAISSEAKTDKDVSKIKNSSVEINKQKIASQDPRNNKKNKINLQQTTVLNDGEDNQSASSSVRGRLLELTYVVNQNLKESRTENEVYSRLLDQNTSLIHKFQSDISSNSIKVPKNLNQPRKDKNVDQSQEKSRDNSQREIFGKIQQNSKFTDSFLQDQSRAPKLIFGKNFRDQQSSFNRGIILSNIQVHSKQHPSSLSFQLKTDNKAAFKFKNKQQSSFQISQSKQDGQNILQDSIFQDYMTLQCLQENGFRKSWNQKIVFPEKFQAMKVVVKTQHGQMQCQINEEQLADKSRQEGRTSLNLQRNSNIEGAFQFTWKKFLQIQIQTDEVLLAGQDKLQQISQQPLQLPETINNYNQLLEREKEQSKRQEQMIEQKINEAIRKGQNISLNNTQNFPKSQRIFNSKNTIRMRRANTEKVHKSIDRLLSSQDKQKFQNSSQNSQMYGQSSHYSDHNQAPLSKTQKIQSIQKITIEDKSNFSQEKKIKQDQPIKTIQQYIKSENNKQSQQYSQFYAKSKKLHDGDYQVKISTISLGLFSLDVFDSQIPSYLQKIFLTAEYSDDKDEVQNYRTQSMNKEANIMWKCKGCKFFAKRTGQIKFYCNQEKNIVEKNNKSMRSKGQARITMSQLLALSKIDMQNKTRYESKINNKNLYQSQITKKNKNSNVSIARGFIIHDHDILGQVIIGYSIRSLIEEQLDRNLQMENSYIQFEKMINPSLFLNSKKKNNPNSKTQQVYCSSNPQQKDKFQQPLKAAERVELYRESQRQPSDFEVNLSKFQRRQVTDTPIGIVSTPKNGYRKIHKLSIPKSKSVKRQQSVIKFNGQLKTNNSKIKPKMVLSQSKVTRLYTDSKRYQDPNSAINSHRSNNSSVMLKRYKGGNIKFPKAPRFRTQFIDQTQKHVPGPGYYQIPSQFSRHIQIQ